MCRVPIRKVGIQVAKSLNVKTDQTLTQIENHIQTENQTLTEAKMMEKILKDRAVIKIEMPTVTRIKIEDQTLLKNQGTNLIIRIKTVAVAEEKAEAKEKMLPL